MATSRMFSPARADAFLQRVADIIARWHGAERGRITCAVAARAPEACSPKLLRAARDLVDARGTRTTIHLNQSQWEVEMVVRQRSVGPASICSSRSSWGRT